MAKKKTKKIKEKKVKINLIIDQILGLIQHRFHCAEQIFIQIGNALFFF